MSFGWQELLIIIVPIVILVAFIALVTAIVRAVWKGLDRAEARRTGPDGADADPGPGGGGPA